MGLQDILVYIIVAGCVIFAFRHYIKILFRKKSKDPGCGYGCAGCPHASRGCSDDRLKKTGAQKKARQ